MYEEPEDDPDRKPIDPAARAKDKIDEFRMHAELCAVFEAVRKFNAQLVPGLDPDIARNTQRSIAMLERSRMDETALLPEKSMPDAAKLLNVASEKGLSTNDYHIHRRPGETMILRWLEGEQVDSFYTRLQAHFDAALNQFRDDEKQSKAWKGDEATAKYLESLESTDIKMADRYARDVIRQHRVFLLSTQSADEMDILHLCDFIMGLPAAEVVGKKSAPPDVDATESDRAWFFKLFALRGMSGGIEKMLFFTYLQKADGTDFDDE